MLAGRRVERVEPQPGRVEQSEGAHGVRMFDLERVPVRFPVRKQPLLGLPSDALTCGVDDRAGGHVDDFIHLEGPPLTNVDMPEPTAARAAPAAQGNRQDDEGTVKRVFGIVQQVIFFYLVSQLIKNFVFQPSQPAAPAPQSSDVPDTAAKSTQTHAYPLWTPGTNIDLHFFLSPSPFELNDASLPHFTWKGIEYGKWDESREWDGVIKVPQSVMNNGTLWAHIFLTKNGVSPSDMSRSPTDVHHSRKRALVLLLVRKEKSLLTNSQEEIDDDAINEEPEDNSPVSYWHPQNVTLTLISDFPNVPITQLPPPVVEHISVQAIQDKYYYHPILFPNDFWLLKSGMNPINSTTTELPLHVSFYPLSYMKFTIYASMTDSFEKQPASSAAEIDEVKRMLTETNPVLLITTIVVSMLHGLFEILAFKNDISHWRGKKEMVGVSVRTIVTNVVVQLIILLYLIDNNAETSYMILMGQGTGIIIEAWKITKAVDISIVNSGPGSIFPYRVDIKDKHVLSEDEKKTQEYDRLAFRYVSYVTIPLLAGYTIYSLVYETHRGWYSFVISTLTSFVYMFGFAQLIPQLIINYKLKSVAHMPMKAMIYKTLGTVVDDFFAFCIKMPILHRLACFRDDVVFLIFLYQRWIYRIDPKRVNEYGQVGEDDLKALATQAEKDPKESKKSK
ncbi:Cleft lip and palate transmembrane protein [Ceratobasidium theobromae]|uniref:Cleft lip and palate transmembrane protein n=1 Tax=Ceratobasidium theobromae TaxID=1582974 RepID=A0A5N5QKV1_9AGAM|nr:Cleft lip and palate transmembrane protein [Ceratobasidium theobromae]